MPSNDKKVIIVGAGADRSRFANKAVRCYLEAGWTVYPVHPKDPEVEGLAVSPTVAEVPGDAGTMLLYVRPDVGMQVVEQAPAKGVKIVFVNPGAGSPELIGRIRELGMEPIEACSIIAQGRSPGEFTG